MNFKEATDVLFTGVRREELASLLDVSVASIRQARLREETKAFPNPPENWENAIIKLAKQQIEKSRKLIELLRF